MRCLGRLCEQGFTLVELLVTTGVISLAAFLSVFFLLTPDNFDSQNNESERRTEIAQIAQAINRYAGKKGELPPDMPTKLTAIGSYDEQYDLCKYLVPDYLKDMPLDPEAGVKTASSTDYDGVRCIDKNIKYATSYAIIKGKNNSVIIIAPLAETEDTPAISITIKPLH
jgi:prepilin-type N-terminal cleavage/methylation domain-containing protein